MDTATGAAERLARLLELIRRARTADSDEAALRFIAVNDTHLLAPYQQAALLIAGRVVALSGLIEPEANTPFVRWLERVTKTLSGGQARRLSSADLPPELASDWSPWLPAHALWVPGRAEGEGVLYAREMPWTDPELALISEWIATWTVLHGASQRRGAWWRMRKVSGADGGGWRRRGLWLGLAGLAIALIPVRLSVLAPAELIPVDPLVIRAPIDGVIERFHVTTNQRVTEQQPLFSYDRAFWTGRLAVAEEALRSAEAEERQQNLRALQDSRARTQLALARSVREERRIEVDYLRGQLGRVDVPAPRGGVVLMEDSAEWIGRPVSAGQRILRIVEPEAKEIEIWLPAGDAIVLPEGSDVRLYLQSSPLAPVHARLRSVAFEAVRRPDGSYAYRVLASLETPTPHRIGLKGTARLHGTRVPAIYWVLRRPLAWVREFAGI